MVKDGIATTAQIDEAILYGFGLRMAQMGQFETYRLSGDEAGMAHFLARFGPTLAGSLTHLMDVPTLDTELIGRITSQSDAQSDGRTIAEMEQARDQNLVALIRALKPRQAGAGSTVRAHEARLPLPQDADLPVTARRVIPSSWIDANGHMNEAHYVEIASDALTERCGVTAAYIAGGHSHFTAETHVRNLAELQAGEEIGVRTQVLRGTGKKTHLFHRFGNADGIDLLDLANHGTHALDGRRAQERLSQTRCLCPLVPGAEHPGTSSTRPRGDGGADQGARERGFPTPPFPSHRGDDHEIVVGMGRSLYKSSEMRQGCRIAANLWAQPHQAEDRLRDSGRAGHGASCRGRKTCAGDR